MDIRSQIELFLLSLQDGRESEGSVSILLHAFQWKASDVDPV